MTDPTPDAATTLADVIENTAPSVVEALAEVAADVREVRKEQRNEHGNYNFRGIDAVVNAVGPALRRHGVLCVPASTDEMLQSVVQTTNGKAQTATRVLVTYRFYGPAGDHLDCQVWGESWDSSDKGMPQAYSVAYRTALLQALTIPTDDVDPHSHDEQLAGAPASIDEADAQQLTSRLQDLGESDLDAYNAWRAQHNIPTVRKMTAEQAVLAGIWLDTREDTAWARDDEPSDRPMTELQSRKLHALLRSVRGATGPGRFPVLTALVGREITSTKELTATEAAAAIDQLTAEEATSPTEGDPA